MEITGGYWFKDLRSFIRVDLTKHQDTFKFRFTSDHFIHSGLVLNIELKKVDNNYNVSYDLVESGLTIAQGESRPVKISKIILTLLQLSSIAFEMPKNNS